ncbi:hypothetical protein NPX13_g6861 [Xylaria arbuscula]|uniref:Zn(2)-C6 fungal-type domain-containing protein n=1 Tax=Xylaria arbuscula TaxID=114810 RepID=A0A9W8NBR3_9PEZI|nr:hypothetical protein NPX13_g6861 [Xylaria arbuscula]
MPEEQHSVGKVKELPKMTQEITQRRACDRCHGLKLRCRRSDGEQCERCRKANQTCTSSPSLRHHKKKSPRGRTIGSMSRPIQIRPGPIEATGDAPPLPPQRERVSCDSMSQSEQAPAAASPFEDTANKHIARPPSLPGAELSLTTPQRPAVLKSHILSQPKQGGCGALPERHSTDLAELEYLQLRPPLPYSQFQDIARLNQEHGIGELRDNDGTSIPLTTAIHQGTVTLVPKIYVDSAHDGQCGDAYGSARGPGTASASVFTHARRPFSGFTAYQQVS